METSCLENSMPYQNQKQAVNSERREPEHAVKLVRFAGKSCFSSSTSAATVRGPEEPVAANVNDDTINDDTINDDTSSSDTAEEIGPQLKLLPLNDQIRELQTIIRDK